MSNKEIDCDIVLDLLPLYCDSVVSEKTADAIKSHLENCEDCMEEYNTMCTELPISNNATTKDKFKEMIKKQFDRVLLYYVIGVVLTCALLIGAYFAVMSVAVIPTPDEETQIVRTYKYDTEEGAKLFLLTQSPFYNGVTSYEADLEIVDGVTNLDISKKVGLGGEKDRYSGLHSKIYIIDIDEDSDFETLTFLDEIILNEEKNNKTPDYVYCIDELYGEDSLLGSLNTSIANDYIGVRNGNGNQIYWDLDGNLIYEGDDRSEWERILSER